ncbi:peroxiredoxin [Neorhizobium sp. AL 9.2.2]|uniref:peroxiredoxin family protein n=1 Tax=Neorhizobium sp. AL 9.2.2 TaxID=2712894 RepID=UPI000DE154C0|nr:redoxin domain-containing protein [Neorhizobium sp. AL 9.2.2]NSY20171.1 redoxin domain-containing protein [Neorhizobium sp. AL 9.2.2]
MSPSNTECAPELVVDRWFNTHKPITLASLLGMPVLLHGFQLLCPGCVSEALPQLKRIQKVFGGTDLQIIGLHTVFEHHAAMPPVTLEAFIHEYGITFPVAIDHNQSTLPVTMQLYGMRGTPSSVLIGRDGTVHHHAFGVEDDLTVGARIAMALAAQKVSLAPSKIGAGDTACNDSQCEVEIKPPSGA